MHSFNNGMPFQTGYLSGYYAPEGYQIHPHHLPCHLQQQFQLATEPRQVAGSQSAASGGSTSASSKMCSPHLLTHHQTRTVCVPVQQMGAKHGGPGSSLGSSGSCGQSMIASHPPMIGGLHGYMTGETVSSNESANSASSNYPPSVHHQIKLGHSAVKSMSNSSGSHCSSRAFPGLNPASMYHSPEPLHIAPQPCLANSHFEQRSSIGDNMTYSEVNSLTDVRDADNEEETDFDDSRSCSVYGQASSIGKLSFSHSSAHSHQRVAKASVHSPSPESPKPIA
ncbi:unnamed protein product [Mesocestoides corti]|uniref:Distal-less homeobox protein 5a n=1 Tax=Mesocestoides corti TaxID=53468 RepID=A0A158QSX9_MESCO|nr:unnamed protein product [Mesocestoides corti]